MTAVPASDGVASPARSATVALPSLGTAEAEHVQLLVDVCEHSRTDRERVGRRSTAWQSPRRHQEQRVRAHAVRCLEQAAAQGWTITAVAAALHLTHGTLKHWLATCAHDSGPSALLGRPLQVSVPAVRNDVLRLLTEHGPGLGVPRLRQHFPELARAELDNLAHRYCRWWRRHYQQALHVLHWQVPGTVWAMDFAEPPAPIDGRYPYLLAVRDLGSGQQLLWLPVADETAQTVVLALAMLLAIHGAPLVVKTDNGSAFGSEEVQALWNSAGVIPLFSPPYWPRYNGAIEAAIGSLKTRTEAAAQETGHPGCWTRTDLAAAQHQANVNVPPKGPRAQQSPADLWTQRPRVHRQERALFQEAVTRCRAEAQQEEPWLGKEPPQVMSQRALDRKAISRALVERGYLLFKRRRIPLPITRPKQLNFG